ncbi:AbrB/MazE/SpoVT family DNA-binding domain-containing protein [Euzebya tangerina]|uniref:AbrB/MazE/SpoVT family DNA-binding domain-containing protein n=1 Tax=Euzebya tangerina TaxID=591198 RepID=UPI000E312FDD|nr:AbrB/MazE/SpoVT family DNA-binding domain-containing protein [Euzebya tangerina]
MTAGSGSGRGVRRKVDDLGRIVIPASMRRVLGIIEGDELEVRLAGDTVSLAKPRTTCTFCDSPDDLSEVLNRPVCWSCVAAVRARGREGR